MRSLGGSCPTVTFMVDIANVYATSSTEFAKGKCRDLANGSKVAIKGKLMSDLRVRADQIELQKSGNQND